MASLGEDLSEGVFYEKIHGPAYEKFWKSQKAYTIDFVKFQPYNQVMPLSYAKYDRKFQDFEIREDDVWVTSFPKCGTTWTQEMVWCIMNNLNFEGAKEKTLDDRVPFFEWASLCDDWLATRTPDYMEVAAQMKSPRIIKSHLAWDMLPKQMKEKNPKIIYVTRNPRDVCVSFYHHWQILDGYTGTFEDFIEAFLEGVCGYNMPFIPHVLDYWNRRHLPNVLFLTYEEMKKDLAKVINEVSSFLGKQLDPNDIPKLLEHLSFDSMKNNPAVNKDDLVQVCNLYQPDEENNLKFMRQGKTGDWRRVLTPEVVGMFEDWEAKGLEGTDLKFVYEL